MATVPSSTLHLTNPLFSSPQKPYAPLYLPNRHRRSATIRATTEEESDATEPSDPTTPSDPDSFENRLSQVRLRYRSGTGKKAEVRKARKSKKGSSSSGAGLYLPPVPLKEPVSGGLKVEFGFSPYSERVNGRIAMLGLSALLLVELATGKSVINYHSPSIVIIQVYFVAAVSAIYLKFLKERVSLWPQSPQPEK
ncbi:uncharacterized protein LOC132311988 [Cornus florida]|uniref:uncharacterized protein LOC132311988 n=1 Tax=Cornus florida TaxID=4283 RepID=UPI00289DD8FF|nr:uncharacterized protein LOC132311988 [Cornus florida]